ncbi:hypothetical protein NFX39_01290 [Fructobacillus sp. W13]|uniref:Uncharacterized protein n=1 Tax=Fructobacillus apis TaxID=2935017 RepID=A0ABT0ZP48_9LACO|nr:hypothetical protein [Fructobacillus apis]MCO0831728.1 hypothetical protein [Fructobacillus apis]
MITKIKTKELKNDGRAESYDWDDLAIPESDYASKKELAKAVAEAYDLGEVTALSHVSSKAVLKATLEKDGQAYHLSAHVKAD